MIIEQWKSIKDFEGWYEVSDLGRVRSLDRTIDHPCGAKRRKGIILKEKIDTHGYCFVILCRNAYRKHCLVHRLVAQQFIKNPFNKPAINHKTGNKLDNRAAELEWATNQENSQHSYDTGLDNKRSMSKEKAAEIKRMISKGVRKIDISRAMKVSYSIVQQIGFGKIYKTA